MRQNGMETLGGKAVISGTFLQCFGRTALSQVKVRQNIFATFHLKA